MGILSFREPSDAKIRLRLAEQAELEFSYAAVGATAQIPPADYAVDRTRIQLGVGEETFIKAKKALQRWQQFQLGWVEPWPADTPLEVGQVVAIKAKVFHCWWLNVCRIVYTVDESGPIVRFGFAYGTLPGHVEQGEERFLIEWNRDTNTVCYDILAFSRPHHPLAWFGYPLVRRFQKRFGRDSATSMFRAVDTNSPLPEIVQSTT